MTVKQLKDILSKLKKGNFVVRTYINENEEHKEIYYEHVKNFVMTNLNEFTLVQKFSKEEPILLKYEMVSNYKLIKYEETIIICINLEKNNICVDCDIYTTLI